MIFKFRILVIVIFSLISSQLSHAGSFGLNIYGLSFHLGEIVNKYDKYGAINEVNVGIGIRADFGSLKGDSYFIEGGIYNDSFNNDAKYISIGYQIRIWNQLRLGLNCAFYNTKSTNKGETFFAPVPILSYRVWRMTVNTVYLPKYEPINPFYIFGVYLTFTIVQGK